MTAHLFEKIRNDFDVNVGIQKNADSTWTLSWDDGVANEWNETFPHLSIALARMAVLVHCGELDWEVGFRSNPETFASDVLDHFMEMAG